MRKALAALAVVVFAAHLPFLPPSVDDLDGINFAMGVRHFDVALHRPHPPGYPIYIAAARLSTAGLSALGVDAPEARGLAIWSALCGALMVPLLFALFHALDGSARRAWWATLLTAASPLVWFSGLRPLSDIPGLAVAVLAQALLVRSIVGAPSTRDLVAGAVAAGLAIGVRSQSFALTLPVFLLALAMPRVAAGLAGKAAALAAFAAGVIVWAVPLVVASGGLEAYLTALAQQGGEDFGGVVMFWNFPTVAVGLSALRHTFLTPWASVPLAIVVLAAAAAGFADVARHRRLMVIAAILTAPYAVFHLLFHETLTVRYALPLVPMIAWLAVRGVDRLASRAVPAVATAVMVWGLVLVVPAGVRFGSSPAPIFRAIEDLSAARLQTDVVAASHRPLFTESRRARTWLEEDPTTWLPAPRDFEWLELTRAWRSHAAEAVWFFADPRRTDLALIDARAASIVPYRWGFDADVFVGGARPREFDVHIYGTPNWFLEEGWALTPQVAGVSAREGWMPHLRPSVGWIRRAAGAADMVLGGRHLGLAGDPPIRLLATLDGRPIVDREIVAGSFVERVALPTAALSGDGAYAALQVRSVSQGGAASAVLEQFDVQPAGVPMMTFESGWHEAEYKPETARSWRWMSRRAGLWIRPIGRTVRLTLTAESPLRYFKASPTLRVSIGAQELARLRPTKDFVWEVAIPAEILAAAEGRLVIESDQSFVPSGAATGDQRELALRVYRIAVN
ncbi:hypothetical protein BH24ACI5_BH24ACI5_12390 [soil metagenome]